MPNAKKFIEQLHKDKVLRKKVNEASQHIVKVAKRHGYPEVTCEEISDALKENWTINTNRPDTKEATTDRFLINTMRA